MDLKEISKEQVTELLTLMYPTVDLSVAGVTFKYQPYLWEWYEDAAEYFNIFFLCSGFGSFTYPVTIRIYPNLDVHVWYNKPDTTGLTYMGHGNQYNVLKMLESWGLSPREELRPSKNHTAL